MQKSTKPAGQLERMESHHRVAPRRVPDSTNIDLLNRPGSRGELDTPCLVVELSQLERNIELAATMASEAGKALWPHMKAHKCVEIARRQLAAGASGLSVASIGEAEVFAAHGLGPILITSTVATNRQIERIITLLKNGTELTLVADNSEFVIRLNSAVVACDLKCDVVVDVDMGRGRSGCNNVASAVSLVQTIEECQALAPVGLQTYAGHLSHMNSFTARRDAARLATERSRVYLDAISNAVSRNLTFCTGGSTGASQFDLHDEALSSLQWGSYVFMDVEYGEVEIMEPQQPQSDDKSFKPSLFVASRVISAVHDGYYTTDAGDKRFANKYGAMPRVVSGASVSAKFKPVSDEHGILKEEQKKLAVGHLLELEVPHSDPTVNLFDHLHVLDGDTLVDIWTVDARGVY